MNCDACPHMKRIRAALAPCQVCEAGRMHGQVSTDAAPTPETVYAHRAANDHTPSRGVTTLTPDTEDALRKLSATIFALDDIELLLLKHIMRGGSYASFADVLNQMYRRLRTKEAELSGKKSGFRSLAHSWARKIVEKMPILGRMFADLVEERR